VDYSWIPKQIVKAAIDPYPSGHAAGRLIPALHRCHAITQC
jgi:hypothetical protein